MSSAASGLKLAEMHSDSDLAAFNDWYRKQDHVTFESFDTFTPLPSPPNRDAVVHVSCLKAGKGIAPQHRFIDPVFKEDGKLYMPDHAFLVEKRAKNGIRRLVFDLGMREDGRPLKEAYSQARETFGFSCAKGSDTILKENGVSLDSVEAVILCELLPLFP
jgi:hypothetical protein